MASMISFQLTYNEEKVYHPFQPKHLPSLRIDADRWCLQQGKLAPATIKHENVARSHVEKKRLYSLPTYTFIWIPLKCSCYISHVFP